MPDTKLKEKKEVIEKPAETPKPKKKSNSAISKNIIRVMNMFGIFNRDQIVHALPFILFITILIIGYIGNSYYAEHVIREIDKKKTDLKEKRAQYISIMSRLNYQSNQTEVAKALEAYEVKENTEPQEKIFIKDEPAK